MTRTKLVLFFAVLAGLLVPAGIQAAGTRVYVKIVGKTQGTFKGEATRVAGTNYIDVYRYNYGVISPRDPSTGLPTGKRQQQSVIITKEIDATVQSLAQISESNATASDEILATMNDLVKIADSARSGAETFKAMM